MHIFPLFYYNVDAGEGAGAGGDTSTEQNAADKLQVPESIISADELKNFGFETKEALLNHLQSHKENSVSDDEKAKKAGIEKAELLKFSVENDIMKADEFATYESLQAKADRDLVFESYLKEWKEENPDVKEGIEEAAKSDFEEEYKLSSDNEKARARGEAKLKREAQDLRAPLEKNYTTAKERYSEDAKMRAAFPKYNDFVDSVIKENIPEKMTIKLKDGETEVPVDVEITEEIRKKAEEKFKNEKVFYSFYKTDGKVDDLKKSLSAKMQSFLRSEAFDTIAAKIYETAKGIGIHNGSDTGADNSFALVKTGKNPDAGKPLNAREGVMKNQLELRDKVNAYK